MRQLIRRFRTAQNIAVAQAARIRELEASLDAAEDGVRKLARSRGDVDHVIQLEKQLKRLTESVQQLRAGVVDDAQTTELRRQLHQERQATRALENRLAELQAANSGIPSRIEVAP